MSRLVICVGALIAVIENILQYLILRIIILRTYSTDSDV